MTALDIIKSADGMLLRQLIASKPLWAQMFYLIRTGHVQEALDVAISCEKQLNDREPTFLVALRAWAESADRR